MNEALEALRALKEQLQGLPSAMPDMLAASFRNIAPLVEDLNIQQLSRGERVDGSKLPDYSPVSVLFYGKTPGPMILHDRGDYWRGIECQVSQSGIELVGTDIKTEMLDLRYGDTIGLQQSSIDTINQEYLPTEVEQQILKRIQ